jgi:hypothetical protein
MRSTKMPPFDEDWHALSREAGLAAEHIAIGATALGRANYAQVAYYAQAFFALPSALREAASSHSCSIIQSIMEPFHLKIRSDDMAIISANC